eukprot:scaffold649_cov347-Pavlova_lutheri.AAC.64
MVRALARERTCEAQKRCLDVSERILETDSWFCSAAENGGRSLVSAPGVSVAVLGCGRVRPTRRREDVRGAIRARGNGSRRWSEDVPSERGDELGRSAPSDARGSDAVVPRVRQRTAPPAEVLRARNDRPTPPTSARHQHGIRRSYRGP